MFRSQCHSDTLLFVDMLLAGNQIACWLGTMDNRHLFHTHIALAGYVGKKRTQA